MYTSWQLICIIWIYCILQLMHTIKIFLCSSFQDINLNFALLINYSFTCMQVMTIIYYANFEFSQSDKLGTDWALFAINRITFCMKRNHLETIYYVNLGTQTDCYVCAQNSNFSISLRLEISTSVCFYLIDTNLEKKAVWKSGLNSWNSFHNTSREFKYY